MFGTLSLICVVATVVTFSLGLCLSFMNREELGGILMIAAVILLVPSDILSREDTQQFYETVRENIASGYALYVNGVEVDVSHITLEDYSTSIITVDDDTKEIHIAANTR